MMRLNSYISNSSYRKYILCLLTFFIFWIALAVAMIIFNQVRKINIPQDALYNYQLNKISQMKHIDTIFVGDSSLGNAINVRIWDRISGQKSASLALTASVYGYVGAYMMLSNSLMSGAKPKNVVIFFHPSQLWEQISYMSFFQQSKVFWSNEIPLYELIILYWKTYMNKHSIWFNFQKLFFDQGHIKTSGNFSADYIQQLKTVRKDGRFLDKEIKMIKEPMNKENIPYLKKIHDLCQKNNINCIYVYGPTVNSHCIKMKDFILQAEKYIKEAGFEVVKGTPICPPSIDMGDTPYHIHPDVKDEYTLKYYDLIKGYIGPAKP